MPSKRKENVCERYIFFVRFFFLVVPHERKKWHRFKVSSFFCFMKCCEWFRCLSEIWAGISRHSQMCVQRLNRVKACIICIIHWKELIYLPGVSNKKMVFLFSVEKCSNRIINDYLIVIVIVIIMVNEIACKDARKDARKLAIFHLNQENEWNDPIIPLVEWHFNLQRIIGV